MYQFFSLDLATFGSLRLDLHSSLNVDIYDFLCFTAGILYWSAFLFAADIPRSVVCHSHWMVDNFKMSKCVGNIIDPMSQ